MHNRILDTTGLGKPCKSRGLTRTGPGLARQESAGRVFGRVWNQTDLFLGSKPGPLGGYPDPLLTLATMSWRCFMMRMLRLKCLQSGSSALFIAFLNRMSMMESLLWTRLKSLSISRVLFKWNGLLGNGKCRGLVG
jgi:hypothetical protein